MAKPIRLLSYAAGIYLYFRIGFPYGQGAVYHILAPLFLAGLACGWFFLSRLFEVGLGRLTGPAGEALFILAVVLFVGLTLPQNSRVPPLEQLSRGEYPTRATAVHGLLQLGLDPNSAAGRAVLLLFP